MTTQLSQAELNELQVLCAETGTDLPHLAAEARRWKAISGRLGLSLEMVLDALSRLEDVPRDPTSADWREVEKVAAEGSLAELRYAQQELVNGSAATDGQGRPTGDQSGARARMPCSS